MMRLMTAAAFGLALLAGSAQAQVAGEDAKLQAFIVAANKVDAARDPTQNRTSGAWTPITDAYREASIVLWQKRAADLPRQVDRKILSPSGRVQYDIYSSALNAQALEAQARARAYFITGNILNFNMLTEPSAILRRQRVTTTAEAEAYVQRLKTLPPLLSDALAIAKAREARGVTMIKTTFGGIVRNARAQAAGAPCEGQGDNPLWTDFKGKVEKAAAIPAADKTRLLDAGRAAIAEAVCPAYARFEGEVAAMEKNGRTEGLWTTPGGRQAYADVVELSLNARVDPDELHQLGLKEVARLQGEIAVLKQTLGVTDEGALRDDPKTSLPNTEAGRAAYQAMAEGYLDDMQKRLPGAFAYVPPRDGLIVRMGEIGSQYTSDEVGGKRVGVFNLSRPGGEGARFSTVRLASLSYHEGVPGHHLQGATLTAMRTGPDLFQRPFSASFNEGWGLYAERLAEELGAYDDNPYGRLGYLQSMLERAERLVLDTGLNAKDWTVEKAAEHQRSVSGEGGGLNRFLNWPGQALGYYWGYLEIMKLRDHAQKELGPRFDLKGFHATILKNGSVPFPVLEQLVDHWIADVKKARR